MARKMKRRLRSVLWLLGLVLLIGGVAGGISASKSFKPRPAYLDLPRVVAVRSDVRSTVVVGGGIDTGKKTIIEVELEGSFAQGGQGGGVSTIIELVDDGAMVKKGQ